ncbi:MAG: hypothetical protein II864_10370 [Prevotella sp.]|nr:hypothetical protein [Prevotella sp.]
MNTTAKKQYQAPLTTSIYAEPERLLVASDEVVIPMGDVEVPEGGWQPSLSRIDELPF